MIVYKEYNRARAVEYARRWALSRNPLFTNFAGRGGDCTNFVSQCIYAGTCQMNFTPSFGWYYIDQNESQVNFRHQQKMKFFFKHWRQLFRSISQYIDDILIVFKILCICMQFEHDMHFLQKQINPNICCGENISNIHKSTGIGKPHIPVGM